MSNMKLTGKTALVTGGGSGIGSFGTVDSLIMVMVHRELSPDFVQAVRPAG